MVYVVCYENWRTFEEPFGIDDNVLGTDDDDDAMMIMVEMTYTFEDIEISMYYSICSETFQLFMYSVVSWFIAYTKPDVCIKEE